MAKSETIKPGYFVAISLIPGTAPEYCYIGLVQVLDEYGIRITQVEWDDQLDGVKQYSEDIFVRWSARKKSRQGALSETGPQVEVSS